MSAGSWILLAVAVAVVLLWGVPRVLRWRRDAHRRDLIRRLEHDRGARVITLIHRQETVGLLGVPFDRFIDIDDSEQLLRAIRKTPPDAPIDLLLHTPGGLVLASEQIAYAVRSHPRQGDGPRAPLRDVGRHADRARRRRDRHGPGRRARPGRPAARRPAAWVVARGPSSRRWSRITRTGTTRTDSSSATWHARPSTRCAPRSGNCWTAGCRTRRRTGLRALLSEGHWTTTTPHPAGGGRAAGLPGVRRRARARLRADDAVPATEPAAAVCRADPDALRTRGGDT